VNWELVDTADAVVPKDRRILMRLAYDNSTAAVVEWCEGLKSWNDDGDYWAHSEQKPPEGEYRHWRELPDDNAQARPREALGEATCSRD